MSKFMISGGRKLHGEILVHGAKNGVLPLLSAVYLCRGQCIIHNCPKLSDVDVSLKILEHLGCKYTWHGSTVIIDSSNSDISDIPECLMHQMRSSIVFLGALLAKTGKASISLPGGCELGPRPIDIHVDALEKLGAEVDCCGGILKCVTPGGIKGADIHLKFPSGGATENIILAATLGHGTTVISNAAKEPEIEELILFLNNAGADIKGGGSDTVTINGVNELHGVEFTVMPDRIIAATCMLAVAACNGHISIKNAVPEHVAPIISCLKNGGCEVDFSEKGLILKSNSRQRNFDTVISQPYPGFPTDAGPQLVAMSSVCKGTGVFIENIFDSRFRYIDELKRMGADIKTVGRVAVITGVKSLDGTKVFAHDLRGGAALTVAAMAANGVSYVENIEYIDRGYEKAEDIFGSLGADIKRIQE